MDLSRVECKLMLNVGIYMPNVIFGRANDYPLRRLLGFECLWKSEKMSTKLRDYGTTVLRLFFFYLTYPFKYLPRKARSLNIYQKGTYPSYSQRDLYHVNT